VLEDFLLCNLMQILFNKRSTVNILTSESKDLVGIYFQDEEMSRFSVLTLKKFARYKLLELGDAYGK